MDNGLTMSTRSTGLKNQDLINGNIAAFSRSTKYYACPIVFHWTWKFVDYAKTLVQYDKLRHKKSVQLPIGMVLARMALFTANLMIPTKITYGASLANRIKSLPVQQTFDIAKDSDEIFGTSLKLVSQLRKTVELSREFKFEILKFSTQICLA